MSADIRAMAGIATATGLVGSARASVRSYYSTQHLWAAQHFTRLAADFERDHAGQSRIFLQHRSYVIGAVMESVAFLETFINEIFEDASDGESGAVGGLAPNAVRRLAMYWRDHDRAETLAKYRMARILVGCEAADAGRRPHEDVRHVIKLRNWLTHYKPRTLGEESPDKLIDHIRGRFADNPLLERAGATWFPNHALSAGCAAWAVQSTHAFVDEFTQAIGSTRPHHRLKHDEEP
jgi:hypothetical protein